MDTINFRYLLRYLILSLPELIHQILIIKLLRQLLLSDLKFVSSFNYLFLSLLLVSYVFCLDLGQAHLMSLQLLGQLLDLK